ncbi:MAG: succinate dehydrogenase/fumarate reductase iron-sulfur subunit [Archaeoglobaceae archaeon]
MNLKIFRYNPETGEQGYDNFEIEAEKGKTVLASLFEVQKDLDDSLAFRYSCRGAVCGTCAMMINKVPRLACRTQVTKLQDEDIRLSPYPALESKVSWDPEKEILIEPLPHLPLIKDLVVDMELFFAFYREIEPYLKPSSHPERENLMEQSAVHALEAYTNCVLCGACFGGCPVDAKNSRYMGPAALAKLYRFHIDPRDSASRLELADKENGWWACEFHTNCRKVCPKGVPPNIAIGKARRELKD